MDRLEAVAHVGQRARDDHAHRVVDVGGAHLVLDRDRSTLPMRSITMLLLVTRLVAWS